MNEIKIRFGSNFHNSGGYVRNILKIVQHQNYNATSIENDISLLKLARPLLYTLSVKSIGLALRPRKNNETCVVSGWGRTQVGGLGSASQQLRMVRVPFIETETCRKTSRYGPMIKDNMVCAGLPQGGKDCKYNLNIEKSLK